MKNVGDFRPVVLTVAIAFMVFLTSGFFQATVWAQEKTDPVSQSESSDGGQRLAVANDLTTETTIQPSDLLVGNPSKIGIFFKRIRRALSLTAGSRARRDLELTNLLLLQAERFDQQGETAAAEAALDQYARQLESLDQTANRLAVEIAGGPFSPTLVKLADEIAGQSLFRASLLDDIRASTKGGQLNEKLLALKLKTLKKTVKLLAKENLSSEELDQKLGQLLSRFESRSGKLEDKLIKRLALLGDLDLANRTDEGEAGEEGAVGESEDLERLIGDEFEETVGGLAAGVRPDGLLIGEVIDKVGSNLSRHLAVLTELHDRLPEVARPAIARAIEVSSSVSAERLVKGEVELSELLPRSAKAAISVQKALDRLSKDVANHPNRPEKVEKALIRFEEDFLKAKAKAAKKAEKELEKAKESKELESEDGKAINKVEKNKIESSKNNDGDNKSRQSDSSTEGKKSDSASLSSGSSDSPAVEQSNQASQSEPKTVNITINSTGICGGAVRAEKDQKVTLKVVNAGIYRYRYEIAEIGLKFSVKPGESEEKVFEAKAAGNFQGQCALD